MIARSTIAMLAVSTGLCARAGIDLTPSATEYVAEGIKHQQLSFVQDKQRIEYEPPLGWKYDGSGAQIRFTPPKKNFAEASISSISLTKPQAMDENTTKGLAQQLISGLPVGSQFVKIEEELQNPVLLNGNSSFEVTASYQLNGEKFLKSALFVNLQDTQLVFRLSARKDDFSTLHRDFKTSIFSWHWIDQPEATAESGSPAAAAGSQ